MSCWKRGERSRLKGVYIVRGGLLCSFFGEQRMHRVFRGPLPSADREWILRGL